MARQEGFNNGSVHDFLAFAPGIPIFGRDAQPVNLIFEKVNSQKTLDLIIASYTRVSVTDLTTVLNGRIIVFEGDLTKAATLFDPLPALNPNDYARLATQGVKRVFWDVLTFGEGTHVLRPTRPIVFQAGQTVGVAQFPAYISGNADNEPGPTRATLAVNVLIGIGDGTQYDFPLKLR